MLLFVGGAAGGCSPGKAGVSAVGWKIFCSPWISFRSTQSCTGQKPSLVCAILFCFHLQIRPRYFKWFQRKENGFSVKMKNMYLKELSDVLQKTFSRWQSTCLLNFPVFFRVLCLNAHIVLQERDSDLVPKNSQAGRSNCLVLFLLFFLLLSFFGDCHARLFLRLSESHNKTLRGRSCVKIGRASALFFLRFFSFASSLPPWLWYQSCGQLKYQAMSQEA